MDSFRLVICGRGDCRQLFFLCRHCDRGDRYCSRACAQAARRTTLQGAGARYQRTRPGRRRHAARQARYRGRRRRPQKVTHQTPQPLLASGIVAPAPVPSLLIEIDDPALRAVRLREWFALPEHVYVRLPDGTKVGATFDASQRGEGRLSSVQYLKFRVGREVPVAVGVALPGLTAETALTPEQRAALAEDLE